MVKVQHLSQGADQGEWGAHTHTLMASGEGLFKKNTHLLIINQYTAALGLSVAHRLFTAMLRLPLVAQAAATPELWLLLLLTTDSRARGLQ